MPDTPRNPVFISYARRDAAELALRLQTDLAVRGFDPWLDTHRLKGGAGWTVEIERNIDNAAAVLAILTPASYQSAICRAEQLRALRKGKVVIPLRARADADIPLHLEPANYRDFAPPGNRRRPAHPGRPLFRTPWKATLPGSLAWR